MKNFIITSLILIAAISSEAQTFKVVKIQGKKAIVEVNDPSAISVNQTYSVGGNSNTSDNLTSRSLASGRRTYGINGAFEFSSLKADTSGAQATDTLYLLGTFLWNMKQYEAGPILGYISSKNGSISSTSLVFGGTGYYNLQENKPGTDQILSAVGSLQMSSVSPSSGTSYTGTIIELGASYRWFLLSSDHCIEFKGLYSMEKSKPVNVDVTTTGFKILGGISTYF